MRDFSILVSERCYPTCTLRGICPTIHGNTAHLEGSLDTKQSRRTTYMIPGVKSAWKGGYGFRPQVAVEAESCPSWAPVSVLMEVAIHAARLMLADRMSWHPWILLTRDFHVHIYVYDCICIIYVHHNVHIHTLMIYYMYL